MTTHLKRAAAVALLAAGLVGATASCATAAPVHDTERVCAPLPTCTGGDHGSLRDMLRSTTLKGRATVSPR